MLLHRFLHGHEEGDVPLQVLNLHLLDQCLSVRLQLSGVEKVKEMTQQCVRCKNLKANHLICDLAMFNI